MKKIIIKKEVNNSLTKDDFKTFTNFVVSSFDKVDKKFDVINKKMDQQFVEVNKKMDQQFVEVNKRFENIEKKFDKDFNEFAGFIISSVDKKLEKIDKRLDTL